MPHANPDERRAYQRRYRAEHPGVHAGWTLKHRYGITVEQLRSLYEQQEGLCAICSGQVCICAYSGGKRCPKNAHVDHDHETNQVRGLLCNGCNWALGALGDNAAGVRRAMQYLTTPAPLGEVAHG